MNENKAANESGEIEPHKPRAQLKLKWRWVFAKIAIVLLMCWLLTERGGRSSMSVEDFSKRGETYICLRLPPVQLFPISSEDYPTYLSEFLHAEGVVTVTPQDGLFVPLTSWTQASSPGSSNFYRYLFRGSYREHWESLIRDHPARAKELLLVIRGLLKEGKQHEAEVIIMEEIYPGIATK